MTATFPAKTRVHPYDQVADQYDQIWSGPEAIAEDRELFRWLNYQSGSVLDVGCGTGLFLDHHTECKSYLGVDPSAAMLRQLLMKHGDAHVIMDTIEGCIDDLQDQQFDLIISLYGSPSYVPQQTLLGLMSKLASNGRIVMMFIAPDYSPVTHQYLDDPPPLYRHDFGLFGTVTMKGNYLLTDYTRAN